MHVMTPRNVRYSNKRRVNLPIERLVVNDNGLGSLEGFNIGKMFKRMVTFTPSSFKPKNIFGALGSVTAFTATGGLSSIVAPKLFSAHSTTMKQLGMGVAAAGVVVGGVLAAPVLLPAAGTGVLGGAGASSTIATAVGSTTTAGGGFLATLGSGISTIGSGLMTGVKAIGSVLPFASQIMGGGGGAQQQYVDPNAQAAADQANYLAYVKQQQYAQQLAAQQLAAEQEYLRQQQLVAQQGYGMNQKLFPTMSDPPNPGGYAISPTMDTALPLPGISYEEGSIIPGVSNTVLFAGVGVALLGTLYLFSGSQKELAHG